MRPITVRGIGVETDRDRSIGVFTLSEPPPAEWIESFRERARSSAFNAAGATFEQNWLRVHLPRREDIGELIREVGWFVELANWDTRFRTPE
jgi:hypothetical protein